MDNKHQFDADRKKVLEEMLAWIPHDPVYVYTLNVYALQQRWITSEESEQVKHVLDEHYKNDAELAAKKNQNKYMMEIFKLIGFSNTKILWRLIEQFPKFIIGEPEDCTFVAHDDAIIKQTGLKSIDYYQIINKLVELGYIEKKKIGKYHCYKINFMFIKEKYEQTL